jgi:hypothetical protein
MLGLQRKDDPNIADTLFAIKIPNSSTSGKVSVNQWHGQTAGLMIVTNIIDFTYKKRVSPADEHNLEKEQTQGYLKARELDRYLGAE